MTFHPEVVDVIDLYVSPQTSNKTKTTGEAYSFVLEQYPSICAEDCVMVGDNPISDIQNAKRKGWKTVLISPYSFPDSVMDSYSYASITPDLTLVSVSDMYNLL